MRAGAIRPLEKVAGRRNVPKELGAITMKALAKAQKDRYQTVEALITQPSEGNFRLHIASGVEDFDDLESAAARAVVSLMSFGVVGVLRVSGFISFVLGESEGLGV